MNTKQHKNNKLVIIISAVVLALVIAGGVSAFYLTQDNDGQGELSTSSSESSSDNDENTSEENTTPSPESDKLTNNSDPQAPTSTDSETGKTIVTMISSAQVSGNTVYIRGGVNNPVDTDGSCYALLSGPSGQSIQLDTPLLPSASTTDCKTIQVVTSELAPGAWTYTLHYSSNTSEGVSDEDTFSLP